MSSAPPLPDPPTGSNPADPVLLAVDSGSARVSVALGSGDSVRVELSSERRSGSESLLQLIDEALRSAELTLESLGGLLGLRGPGSFTGLRIGMATLLGLHEATGVRATAVSSLRVLAHGAARRPECASRPVTAVVDALRSEWFAQTFAPRPQSPPEILTLDELARSRPEILVGADLSSIEAAAESWPTRPVLVEIPTLASTALSLAASEPVEWDPAALLEPDYLRGPSAVSMAEARSRRRSDGPPQQSG